VPASTWSRRLVIGGLALMILGLLDPMEGSIVILIGSLLALGGARLGQSAHRTLIACGCVLIAIGVGAMWGLSAIGGFGGNTGRTLWWWAAIVPYPVGWILALIGTIRSLKRPGPSGD